MLFMKHYWIFIKHPKDNSIYAKCGCGYEYRCSKLAKKEGVVKLVPSKLFNYCPMCGKRFYVTKYKAEREFFL